MHRTGLAVVVAVLASASPAAPVAAQQFDWTGAVNNIYSTSGNWSPVGPPGVTATARFNLATSYNVSFSANATVDAISVNNGSVSWLMNGFTYNAPNTTNSGVGGSLTVRSGTFNAGGLSVGSSTLSNSTLTLDQASTVTLGAGGFSVGSGDHGFLVVKNLSTFTTANATTLVGANPTGVGTATVVGASSSWTANGTVRVGVDGTGTVNVLNGGVMTAAAINVGEGAFGVGTLNVSGLNATFTTAGTANIGGLAAGSAAAAATLAVDPGATINLNGTTNLRTTATVDLTGGTLNLTTLNVETGATVSWTGGKVNFANAATVTGPILTTFLGGTNTLGPSRTLSAAAGTLTLDTPLVVNGGTITVPTITIAAPLVVNQFGTVTATDAVTINSGQTVQVNDLGTLATTNPMFNNGLLQLNGPSAKVNGFAFNLGVVQGTGRFVGGMNNSTLGTIRANAGDHLIIEETGLTNSGIIELNGGTVEYTRTLSNLGNGFITGRGTFRGGTQTPGSTGLSNTGVMAFSSSNTDIYGDVLNTSTGKIIAAGARILTFFDDVTHNGVEIRTNAGSRSVFFGNLSGAGPFTGTGVVEFNGDLRPGNSPALVTFGGDVLLSPASALKIELGGLLPGSQYDRIQVAGELSLGGRLDVTSINGFMPSTGDTFDIMNWGTLDGTFTQITLPALTGSLYWDVSNLYVDGTIVVMADCPTDIAPTSGDGVVDVNDLLAVIVTWGACPVPCAPVTCVADIAPPGGDCVVDVNDLLAIITTWGACP